VKLVTTILAPIDRALDATKKAAAVVLSIAVASLMVIEVITRYVLGEPLFGLEEITLICVMWLYMIGASMACRERSHLKAELVQLIVKSQTSLKAIQVLTTLISLVMAVFITLWAFDLVVWGVEKKQSTPVFEIPWFISQSSLLFGGIFFTLYLVRDLIVDIRRLFGHGSAAKE
jgi:TRAP-type C4-dicarboxylate transport system permease small subunit